jgi:hypothetical protein
MPAWTKVLAAVVLLGAGVGTGMIVRGGHSASASLPLRLTIAPQRGVTLDIAFGGIAALTISPDGRYVTFSAEDADGRPMLWLRPLDALEAKPLAGTESGQCPFWSPDSASIAFFSEGYLKRIDLFGGPAVTLAPVEKGGARSGSWNRDGVIIYAPRMQSAIFRVSANGGPTAQVTKLDPSKQETTHRWARFLPDGKHFLYTVASHGHSAESELNAIYVASLDDPTPKFILRATSQAIYAAGTFSMRGGALVAQPSILGGSWFPVRRVVADNVHYGPHVPRRIRRRRHGSVYARARNRMTASSSTSQTAGRPGRSEADPDLVLRRHCAGRCQIRRSDHGPTYTGWTSGYDAAGAGIRSPPIRHSRRQTRCGRRTVPDRVQPAPPAHSQNQTGSWWGSRSAQSPDVGDAEVVSRMGFGVLFDRRP